MNFVEKTFNDIFYYVNKVEGAKQVGQSNMVAKKTQIMGNFSGSYYRGFGHQNYTTRLIQSTL